jgi:adenine-specific DNA-methyltransferase
MHERFGDIAFGRLNLYTMFMRRAITEIPFGGLVGHIAPASFLGGSEFAAFRRRMLELAEILVVDLLDQRSNVFVDATQDACFVVLRRRAEEARGQDSRAFSGLLQANGRFTPIAKVRLAADGSPWQLVGEDAPSSATLAEWGYRASVGYLVAYRQTERMHVAPGKGRLPLIWAKAIRPDGTFDHAHGVSAKRPGWVSAPLDAPYVVRDPCVVVQRTSSRDQKRRITAAAVPQAFLRQHGGFIGENHVLILVRSRPDAPPPEALLEALNDPTVGQALNRVCGSASIPVRLFEVLPLPPPPLARRLQGDDAGKGEAYGAGCREHAPKYLPLIL